MQTEHAAKIFEVLSSDTRLELFRLLVRSAPDGLVAGEISRRLGIPSTNLSFHLKALLHGNLASVEKEGRFLRYRANIPLMLKTIAFLTEECCQGSPQSCQQFREASGIAPGILPEKK